ncbi:hypothetical protein [Leptolyngbya sp. FACHB-261]|uniref:hypothetical protein n=1 Tax=Leptolyngbya sp. FACHB-261 TaxID=2692806 RepID=UPI001683B263|nr:hypothetical protein [Leptolyngbya sp. FACHB-261]MBD2103878.1 hypothetical protein [Leptolyngbya sp. FACHB-261]
MSSVEQSGNAITLFGPYWHERYGQPHPHVNLQGHPECPERIISNFTSQSCWYSGLCPLGSWSTCLEAIPITDVLAAAEPLLKAYAVKSYVEGALG